MRAMRLLYLTDLQVDRRYARHDPLVGWTRRRACREVVNQMVRRTTGVLAGTLLGAEDLREHDRASRDTELEEAPPRLFGWLTGVDLEQRDW